MEYWGYPIYDDMWISTFRLGNRFNFVQKNIKYLTFKIEGEYTIPEFVSPMARDLITRILQVNPCRRMRVHEIKIHPWLRKDIPIYAKLSTFCTILKEGEF